MLQNCVNYRKWLGHNDSSIQILCVSCCCWSFLRCTERCSKLSWHRVHVLVSLQEVISSSTDEMIIWDKFISSSHSLIKVDKFIWLNKICEILGVGFSSFKWEQLLKSCLCVPQQGVCLMPFPYVYLVFSYCWGNFCSNFFDFSLVNLIIEHVSTSMRRGCLASSKSPVAAVV